MCKTRRENYFLERILLIYISRFQIWSFDCNSTFVTYIIMQGQPGKTRIPEIKTKSTSQVKNTSQGKFLLLWYS